MHGLSPSSNRKLLRKPSAVAGRRRAGSHLPATSEHNNAVEAIRLYLKSRTSYDAFPISFRLIVLDVKLNVKKALQCLLLNGVVSAPLWNSEKGEFAGMLTVLDIIHLIQYYYQTANYDTAASDVEHFRLESLRDIEKCLGVSPLPLLYEHPDSTLFHAATRLIQTHARRLPLLDHDTETGQEVVVSVLTQYRLLKFIAINCEKEISHLHTSLRKLKIGTYVRPDPRPVGTLDHNPYYPISTARMDSPVFDVVHMFSERAVSAVPIIDDNGVVVNLYETVDVITLVRLGAYQSLDLKISDAVLQRAVDFPGVVICNASDSLGTLLSLIKKRRVHRLVVVEGEEEEKAGGKKGRLLGIITLSDVLRYLIGVPVAEGDEVSSLPTSPRMAPSTPRTHPASSVASPSSIPTSPVIPPTSPTLPETHTYSMPTPPPVIERLSELVTESEEVPTQTESDEPVALSSPAEITPRTEVPTRPVA